MKTKNRRGFTLVELLVVIAILAVLATVAILGYSAFTKKATISNDVAIVKQMNTILQANEQLDERAMFPHDAVLQVRDGGFIFENLTPTTYDHHIVYDQKHNRFALLDGKFEIVYADSVGLSENNIDVFVIAVDDESLNKILDENYSVYLAYDYYPTHTFVRDDSKLSVNEKNVLSIAVGVDVGEHEEYTQINYVTTTSQEITIRTNGGSLQVNAGNSTVNHYGLLAESWITNVDNSACYHEFGEVGRLTYIVGLNNEDEGKIYFESTAKVYCYMNRSNDTNANATEEIKADGAIVYTWTSVDEKGERTIETLLTKSNGEEATFHTKAEAEESKGTENKVYTQFDETTGNVIINTCSHHNKDYEIVEIGEATYILCKACGAYSKYDGSTSNNTPSETNIGEGKQTIDNESSGDVVEDTKQFDLTPVQSISISETEKSVEVGNEFTLVATINPTDASIKGVVWSSSDETIATVTKDGLVKALKAGEVVITATSSSNNTIKTTCEITISKKGDGETFTLKSKYTIGDGEKATLSKVKGLEWTTSDAAVVSVKDGVITANKVGTATIEANGKKCEVTVTKFHNGNEAGTSEANAAEIINGKQWYNLCTTNAYDQTKYPGYYWAKGYYKIVADIDCKGLELPYYCEVDNVVIDGQNHTISNVKGVNIFSSGESTYLWDSCTFKDITFNNCETNCGLFAYGVKSESKDGVANIQFENVKIKNSTTQGGAFLYACSNYAGNINFKNCQVTNTNIVCNVVMGCGGYIGNSSACTVSIDGCTFGGSVVVTQECGAGFIGQAKNGATTITNSTILTGTVIRSVAGTVVNAYCPQLGNDALTTNTFNGTLESSADSKMNKQGSTASTMIYSCPCSADDFTLNDDGSITYTGSLTFSKVIIQQTIGKTAQWGSSVYGGYSEKIANATVNNITTNTTINDFEKVKEIRNVIDSRPYLNSSKQEITLGYSTTDDTYIKTIKDGVYYFDAKHPYGSSYNDYYYFIAGTQGTEPESVDIMMLMTIYNDNGVLLGVVSGVNLKYTVNLK